MTASLDRSGEELLVVCSGGGGGELPLFLLAHGDHALGEHRGVVLSVLVGVAILGHPLARALLIISSLLETDLVIKLVVRPISLPGELLALLTTCVPVAYLSLWVVAEACAVARATMATIMLITSAIWRLLAPELDVFVVVLFHGVEDVGHLVFHPAPIDMPRPPRRAIFLILNGYQVTALLRRLFLLALMTAIVVIIICLHLPSRFLVLI